MNLKLYSPSFNEMDYLPRKFSGYGDDISPEFILENLDKDAKSLVITLDDADHPKIKNFNHWILWNMKPMDKIPENLPHGMKVNKPFSFQQGRAYGLFRYKGPKTPKGENHIYVYTIYVLNDEIKASSFSNKKKIMKLIEGKVLQKAELKIRFCPEICK